MYRFSTSNTSLHGYTKFENAYPFLSLLNTAISLLSLFHYSVRLNIMPISHEETEAQKCLVIGPKLTYLETELCCLSP